MTYLNTTPMQSPSPRVSYANTRLPDRDSERRFKSGFMKLLSDKGVPDVQRFAIHRFLQTTKDQHIGLKIQALMSMQPPLIPPAWAPEIAGVAADAGMPDTSLNKENLLQRKAVLPDEAYRLFGQPLDDLTNSLGITRFSEQRVAQSSPFTPSIDPRWMSA